MLAEDQDQELFAKQIAKQLVPLLQPQPDDRPLLSIPQAAARLNISAKGAWNLVRSGALPTVVIGENRRMVVPVDLDEYIAQGRDR